MKNKMIKNVRTMCSWGESRFNNLTPEQKNRQRGITMIEITAGLVIISLLAIFLVPRVGALLGKSKIELGVQEITGLVSAFEQYRLVNGTFGGMNFEALETGGFHIEPFDKDNKANVYGRAIEFDPADPVADNASTFDLVYETGIEDDCNQIELRVKKLSPVSEGVACDTDGKVTLKIGN